LIVPTLVYLLVLGGISAVLYILFSSNSETTTATGSGYYTTSPSVGIGFTGIAVYYLVMIAAGIFMQAAVISGCLDIADGNPVTIGSFFRPRNLGTVILAALLVSVLTAIGNFLCVIPGLIFNFFAVFTIAFATDHALPAVEALKASIATVRSDLGAALLSWLVQFLVLLVGALLCGVGMLVAFPLATLIQTYTYRRLSGGSVAPLTQ
jgi:uncharacterized membrane protein